MPCENGAKTKILLADDHRMVRQGLRHLLANEADLEVVGETDHCTGVVKLARDLKPDVIIIAARLPGQDPVDVVSQIKKFERPQHVLILTTPGNEDYTLQLLLAGADGCIFKTASFSNLVKAIRTVASGQFICDPALERKILKRSGQTANEAHGGVEQLIPREAELLKLAAQGLENKLIADRLTLTVGTVKGYFAHIFSKMGLSPRPRRSWKALSAAGSAWITNSLLRRVVV